MNRSAKMIGWGIGAIVLGLGTGAIILHLHRPRPEFQVRLRPVETQLTEVDLINVGKADGVADEKIVVSWQGSKLQGAAGLAGFGQAKSGEKSIVLSLADPAKAPLLHVGESLAIGWVRLSDPAPVQAQIQPK